MIYYLNISRPVTVNVEVGLDVVVGSSAGLVGVRPGLLRLLPKSRLKERVYSKLMPPPVVIVLLKLVWLRILC